MIRSSLSLPSAVVTKAGAQVRTGRHAAGAMAQAVEGGVAWGMLSFSRHDCRFRAAYHLFFAIYYAIRDAAAMLMLLIQRFMPYNTLPCRHYCCHVTAPLMPLRHYACCLRRVFMMLHLIIEALLAAFFLITIFSPPLRCRYHMPRHATIISIADAAAAIRY